MCFDHPQTKKYTHVLYTLINPFCVPMERNQVYDVPIRKQKTTKIQVQYKNNATEKVAYAVEVAISL